MFVGGKRNFTAMHIGEICLYPKTGPVGDSAAAASSAATFRMVHVSVIYKCRDKCFRNMPLE